MVFVVVVVAGVVVVVVVVVVILWFSRIVEVAIAPNDEREKRRNHGKPLQQGLVVIDPGTTAAAALVVIDPGTRVRPPPLPRVRVPLSPRVRPPPPPRVRVPLPPRVRPAPPHEFDYPHPHPRSLAFPRYTFLSYFRRSRIASHVTIHTLAPNTCFIIIVTTSKKLVKAMFKCINAYCNQVKKINKFGL